MLSRVYLIVGSVLLLGYGVVALEGWEFGNAVRVASVPAIGSSLTSSGRPSTGSSGRSFWIIGGK
jgi:hypothetical protein